MRSSFKDKQNQPLVSQPRLSLKINHTSKKKPSKNEARMSMLPLKRQRLSMAVQSQISQSNHQTALRNNINLLNSSNSISNSSSFFINTCQKSIRKQTIINNLVNKLDQQEQIRSIIQTKLRRNSYGPNKQYMYTSEFQPYGTSSFQSTNKNVNQLINGMQSSQSYEKLFDNKPSIGIQNSEQISNTNRVLAQKLKKCQEQLDYFKKIVADMTKKMKKMQEKQFNSKTNTSNYTSYQTITNDEQYLQSRNSIYNNNKCCKCRDRKSIENTNANNGSMKKYGCADTIRSQANNTSDIKNRKNNSISIQTSPSIVKDATINVQESQNYEFDFFDNLDRTLKILNNSKQLQL